MVCSFLRKLVFEIRSYSMFALVNNVNKGNLNEIHTKKKTTTKTHTPKKSHETKLLEKYAWSSVDLLLC